MGNFNLEDYEPVDSRLKKYAKQYPDFRVKTWVKYYEGDTVVMGAAIFQTKEDLKDNLYHATGFAEEIRGDGYVNKTSHLENCETSAIGRALANANFSGNLRPSREEMEKVSRMSEKTVSSTAEKPLKPKFTNDAYDKAMKDQKCKSCGAEMVRNPKTGKYFCSEKCWL